MDILYADACERYDEVLDDCEGPIVINGITFNPSYILKQLDPIAYREGVLCFMDACDLEIID